MHTRSQLQNLDHSELVEYTLSLSEIKEQLIEVENNVTTKFVDKINELQKTFENQIAKLEGELAIAKNANILLRDEVNKQTDDLCERLTNLERDAYRTAEYVNYETVEISKIPLTIPDKDVATVSLKIINTLFGNCDDVNIDNVHAIHRRQGHFTREKVLVKFVSRNDSYHVLRRAKRLKDIQLEEIDERLVEPVFINEYLSPYYSKLRYACKLLHEEKLVDSFRSTGHKIRVTIGGEEKMISHKVDLLNLLPEKDLSNILRTCRL